MKNIAIIYHDADFDGKLSNEVCRFHLGRLHPDAVIHSYGWDYGRPIPKPSWEIDTAHSHNGGLTTRLAAWEDYDQIYIVDLSVDELMSQTELQDKIVWIDHHKSSIEKWVNQGDKKYGWQFKGYRIDGVAACRLCWQWFVATPDDIGVYIPVKQDYVDRKVTEPELLRLAGEYDIWDHRDPDAKALQFGLRALDQTQFADLVEKQFANSGSEFDRGMAFIAIRTAVKNGQIIKTYCDKQNDEYSAAFSHTIQFEGLTFCALNIGQRGNSDLVRGGLKPEHQAIFAWRYTGKEVMVSLYHAPGHEHHDLSQIAVKYGGGGHKGACGFRCSLVELSSILNNS